MMLVMFFFSIILSKSRNLKQMWSEEDLSRLDGTSGLIESNDILGNISHMKLIYIRLVKLMTFPFKTLFSFLCISFQNVICKE